MASNVDSLNLPIFVATVPVAAKRLRGILAGYRVRCPMNYAQAIDLLSREAFALAVMGVYFDASRMFDLISFARGSIKNARTPIACVLGVRGDLSPLAIRSIEQTVNAMPRTRFLNLAAIPDDLAGNAEVRQFLESLLAARITT